MMVQTEKITNIEAFVISSKAIKYKQIASENQNIFFPELFQHFLLHFTSFSSKKMRFVFSREKNLGITMHLLLARIFQEPLNFSGLGGF